VAQLVVHADARKGVLDDSLFHKPVKCVLTDPPYGVNFWSRRAITPEGKKLVKPIENDGDLDTAVEVFDTVMDGLLPRCADEAELYVFTRWDVVDTWVPVVRRLKRHGFTYKMLLIWDKGVPGMGDIDSNWGCGHELIIYAKKGLRDVPERRSGIIAVDKVHPSRLVHPTEKPVPLIERLLKMSTNRGDFVVDPFAGSGSTLVGAQLLKRDALGFELDAPYVKIINDRLSQQTLF
jgi:adenine-specific DNA-methyltransferase